MLRFEAFVASSLSTRLMGVCKASNRPLPRFSSDDVLDFKVAEAIVAKFSQEETEARKAAELEQKRKEFKEGGFDELQRRVDGATAQ